MKSPAASRSCFDVHGRAATAAAPAWRRHLAGGGLQRQLPRAAAIVVVGACLWLAACSHKGHTRPGGATPAAPAPSSAGHAERAPVVVTLVVDQLGAWVAESKWPALPSDGGFARLRREGTWATTMLYEHAVTDTAPGHAALYTGAPPRESGIFANEVLDGQGARTSILFDASTRTLTPEGTTDAASSSIARLHVPTLADELYAAHPDAIIVGLSLKDRGAIFGCGRHPTACLWLGHGELVSSTAFAKSFPSWALPDGGRAAVARWTDFVWTPTDLPWLRAHATGPDDQPGEGRFQGLGTTFPHDFRSAKEGAARVSPRADAGLFDVGVAALTALTDHGAPVGANAPGATRAPILLAISLSTNDYVGHVYGPNSWESWEEMRTLDASLARFLGRLDALFGVDGYAVLLSGDHGITPLPELQAAHSGGRIDPDALTRALRHAAGSVGLPGAVLGVADPYVVLSPTARALAPAARKRLDGALQATLAKFPGVAKVYAAGDMPPDCPRTDDDDALVCRAFVPGAGDFYVLPRPGWFFDTLYVPGAGTSHGTPQAINRAVPLLVRAPGRVAAGTVRRAPLPFTAFARTAASLLNVPPPPAATRAPTLASEISSRKP